MILIDNIVDRGPQFVGIVSDPWKAALGEGSLRYAMFAAREAVIATRAWNR